jgi:hypothetical protein
MNPKMRGVDKTIRKTIITNKLLVKMKSDRLKEG